MSIVCGGVHFELGLCATVVLRSCFGDVTVMFALDAGPIDISSRVKATDHQIASLSRDEKLSQVTDLVSDEWSQQSAARRTHV